jgi:hypothetical protein
MIRQFGGNPTPAKSFSFHFEKKLDVLQFSSFADG